MKVEKDGRQYACATAFLAIVKPEHILNILKKIGLLFFLVIELLKAYYLESKNIENPKFPQK
jgi:hypothetical protein